VGSAAVFVLQVALVSRRLAVTVVGGWGSPVTAAVLSSLQRLPLFRFFAFSPLSLVFPSVSSSGEVGRWR
jgi:hypothetical protein